MSVEIDIKFSQDSGLSELLSFLSPKSLGELNDKVASAEVENMREYHRAFDDERGWENPALPTHGAGRKSTRFGNNVAVAWLKKEVSSEGFTLTNNATGFAQKVYGGTISSSKSLTIPMVPEAHGVRAGQYPGDLFRPKGKDFLMESMPDGTARIVYLLRKSVTQKAWKGALPEIDTISNRVVDLLESEIMKSLDE